MLVHQFLAADGTPSHAIWDPATDEVILIDPTGDPQPYYDFANARCADIVALIEMLPRAAAREAHLAICRATGATLYVPEQVAATDHLARLIPGDVLTVGATTFQALYPMDEAPGISLLVERSEDEYAVFTGAMPLLGAAASVLSAFLV